MKFKLLQTGQQSCIGVDISATAVKMVELSATDTQQPMVLGTAQVLLPKGAVADGNINDLTQVANTVRQAWKQLATRQRQVVMALPSAAVIAKRVILPAGLSVRALEQAVETEATQFLPFPLEDMHCDFQVMGPLGKSTEEIEVMVVAARKEKVDDRLAVAEEAGLKVRIMDVDAYATELAYMQLPRPHADKQRKTTSMIVDLGAHSMHVNVMVGTHSVYVREQAFGGHQLQQDIQRRFGLSAEESEYARRHDKLPAAYAEELLAPFTQTLVEEIARAVAFFTNSTNYHTIDQMLLGGGLAAIEGLDLLVQAKTNIATQVLNPFAAMSLAAKVKPVSLAKEAPALLVASGLALRGIRA